MNRNALSLTFICFCCSPIASCGTNIRDSQIEYEAYYPKEHFSEENVFPPLPDTMEVF